MHQGWLLTPACFPGWGDRSLDRRWVLYLHTRRADLLMRHTMPASYDVLLEQAWALPSRVKVRRAAASMVPGQQQASGPGWAA